MYIAVVSCDLFLAVQCLCDYITIIFSMYIFVCIYVYMFLLYIELNKYRLYHQFEGIIILLYRLLQIKSYTLHVVI